MRRRRRQAGQVLVFILLFAALFLVVVWAGLNLASGAVLAQTNVQTDTRETYALDAGMAFGMEAIALKAATNCTAPAAGSFTLAYTTTITVTVTVAKTATCKAAAPTFTITSTATGTSEQLQAQVAQAGLVVNWEAFS